MISGEYGWGDEQILDLPLQRLWQVRDAILARRRADHHRQARLVELQTRYLVGAFAGKQAAAGVSFLGEPRRTVTPQLDTLTARYGQPLLRLGAPDGH